VRRERPAGAGDVVHLDEQLVELGQVEAPGLEPGGSEGGLEGVYTSSAGGRSVYTTPGYQ
jgi:hypothetical protein